MRCLLFLTSWLFSSQALAQTAPPAVPSPPASAVAPTASGAASAPTPPPGAAPPPSTPVQPGSTAAPGSAPAVPPPGTYPPASYAVPSYPQSAPNAYPPGAYPPGAYPPGAYPPGAYPPGAYPPGAYPPGAYPPGAYPPGVYPQSPPAPNGVPQGTYPLSTSANAYPSNQQIVLVTAPREREPEAKEAPPHHGVYSRFTAGLGVGHVGGGNLRAKPGFKPIYGLDHTAPVLSLAGQVGAGTENVAFAVELLYEQMLKRVPAPSDVGFHLIALGVAGSYYLPLDFYVTAHLRWVGLILRRPDCLCLSDRLDSTAGPGVGVTVGKEWFGREPSHTTAQGAEIPGRRREASIGLGLQLNYARFNYEPKLEYTSGLVLLTLTHF